MSTALVRGSIGAVARESGRSLAETFIDAECVVIVDTSSSMADRDSRGGRSRYDVACEELRFLQENNEGKVAVLSFSHECIFCPNGVPVDLGGGTSLDKALQFAKVADVPGIRFIVISDGEPDSEERALAVARTYHNRIDTIFVGPEERPYGLDFLRRLAAESGGLNATADRAQELYITAERLLLASA